MTSENLTATQRTVVAEAQELKASIRKLLDLTDGHSWSALVAALGAIHTDIGRLLAVADIVPVNHRMPGRNSS